MRLLQRNTLHTKNWVDRKQLVLKCLFNASSEFVEVGILGVF